MIVLITACGGGDDPPSNGGDVIIATVTRTATEGPAETPAAESTSAVDNSVETPAGSGTQESTPAAVEPTEGPAPPGGSMVLSGFIYPIQGACLPQGDQLMPNAPRNYRNGTHEGIDFYNVDNCTAIGLGTPVQAVKSGRIVRIDHGYVDPTAAQINAFLTNPNTDHALDAFRGRQVWIDHGEGIVTRYCHLSAVVSELRVGDAVAQGATVGYVGESGTPSSVSAPGTEYHLHWEVRVGDSYLGAGQDSAQVRALYLQLFQP